eukprot:5339422-Amphidinium_carterae.1
MKLKQPHLDSAPELLVFTKLLSARGCVGTKFPQPLCSNSGPEEQKPNEREQHCSDTNIAVNLMSWGSLP